MPTPKRPRPATDPRHRRVPESLILEMLALEGWPREMADGRGAEGLAGAGRALDLAIRSGAGFADARGGGRLFDPAEVDQFLGFAMADPSETFWNGRKRIANRDIADFDRTGDGRVADLGASPARFRVALRRRFDLGRFPVGRTVRLRLPLPLACEYHQDITVESFAPGDPAAETTFADGRMEVRLPVPEDPEVLIGADLSLTALIPGASAQAPRLDPAEAERHLRPFEGPIQVTPRVRALALDLARDLPPVQAVTSFWRYLEDNFSFAWLRYDELPADAVSDWLLDTGLYDCLWCSSLLVALCRARGIPARRVAGHCLHSLSPTNHSWVEIWLAERGWTPLDIYNRERSLPCYAVGDGWPDHFVRRGDYKLVQERLPLAFTGPMSVRFPRAWQMLHTPVDQGAAITYIDVADGRLIYRDEVRILAVGP